ncbi:hypothetical protein Q8F55_004455 [Vanrija albida]|uniref:Uncharacterized protein n=1 Tax=Vanrija albida TaxID=181172 RepID=A0ABR3Q6S7_9TREE
MTFNLRPPAPPNGVGVGAPPPHGAFTFAAPPPPNAGPPPPPPPAGFPGQSPRVPLLVGPPHAPHDAAQWTLDALFHVLNPLPSCQRWGSVQRIGRALAAQGQQVYAANLVSALEALDNFYARGLAAGLATAAGLVAWTRAHVGNGDPVIQAWALRSAQRLGDAIDDAAFTDVLSPTGQASAPLAVRRRMLDSLGGRVSLVDSLVAGCMDYRGPGRDPDAAERVLSFASAPVVATHLPELLHALRHPKRLARRHPEELVAALEADLARAAGAPGGRAERWWDAHKRTIAALAKYAPGLVPRMCAWADQWGYVVDAEGAPSPFPQVLLERVPQLVRYEPDRVARLAMRGVELATTRNARRRWMEGVSDDVLARYAAWVAPDVEELFGALPPHRRLVVAAQLLGKVTHLRLAELLHRSNSHALALTALKDMEWINDGFALQAAWCALLPPRQARGRMLDAAGYGTDAQRLAAWRTLFGGAARAGDEAALTDALAELSKQIGHETDEELHPRFHEIVARVPARLFAADALPHLERVIGQFLVPWGPEHRDLVPRTYAQLVMSIMNTHPSSAVHVAWWNKLFPRMLAFFSPSNPVKVVWGLFNVRKGEEHAVYAAFKPVFDQERPQFNTLLAVCRALGPKAARLAPLQAELQAAIHNPQVLDSPIGAEELERAIGYYLADSATRDARVAEVLAAHPSSPRLGVVAARLFDARTDLVTPFLTKSVPVGVFNAPNEEAYIFPWRQTAHRLTVEQHIVLRDMLAARLRQPTTWDDPGPGDTTAVDKMVAISTLAFLHGGIDVIKSCDIDAVAVHISLRAMVGNPEQTPEGMFQNLQVPPFARTVMSTAWRSSLRVRSPKLSDDLYTVMADASIPRLTRADAARMAAFRCPVGAAMTMLARFASVASQRDSKWAWRVAVKLAVRHLLTVEDTWHFIDAAIDKHGTAMLRLLVDVKPWRMPQSVRERYVKYLVPLLEHDDDDLARAAVENIDPWIPYSADIIPGLSRIIANLDIEDAALWKAAVDKLAYAATDDATVAVACATVKTLVDAPQGPDAGEDADRPAYRRVKYFVERYDEDLTDDDRYHHSVIRALSDTLATHPELFFDAANMLLSTINLEWPAEMIVEHLLLFADRAGPFSGMHAGLSASVGQVIKGRKSTPERLETLMAVAKTLVAKDDLFCNMMGNWVVIEAGRRAGWPEAWRDLLRKLRRHPRIEVRYFALQADTCAGEGEDEGEEAEGSE